MLNHCDVLVSIWDGFDGQGQGGTASMVATALQLNVTTVWIDAQAPHNVELLVSSDQAMTTHLPATDLIPQMLPSFLPPEPVLGRRGETGAIRFFAEQFPRWSLTGWVWSVFVDLVGYLRVRPPHFRTATPDQRADDWERDWGTDPHLPEAVKSDIDNHVRSPFIWADALATQYLNSYRSSILLISLLAVVAVFLALIGYAMHWADHHSPMETVRGIAVAGVLASILLLWRVGHERRWHERGINYRLLAELLRQLRYLAPLGRVPAFSRLPAHQATGDPRTTWMGWHARSISRELGLVHASVTPAYLQACRDTIRDGLIGGQLAYHDSAAHRYEVLDRHLRMLGLLTFAGTLAAVLVTFVAHLRWLTLLEAVLPALGAAYGAIRSQGEIERLARRSQAMHEYLQRLSDQIDAPDLDMSSTDLARLAETASNAITTEVSDWHIVFQTRPLELPG
jgi:hypothetical protein